jgi:hypothetical protein
MISTDLRRQRPQDLVRLGALVSDRLLEPVEAARRQLLAERAWPRAALYFV